MELEHSTAGRVAAASQLYAGRLLRIAVLRRAVRAIVDALRVPVAVRQRLPVDAAFEIEIAGRRFVYHSSFYDGVGRALYWSHGYEPETLAPFLERVRDCATFLDVGANTGFFSLAAVAGNPEVAVHAFEPSPAIYEALRRNLAANRLDGRVTARRVAVADEVGEVEFHVPARTWGSGSLDARGFGGASGRLETVPATTLDHYVSTHDVSRVDLLKVDVEGFEHLVLRGARATLAEHRPTIFCEVLSAGPRREIEAIVSDLDYRALHLTPRGAVPVDSLTSDPHGRYNNFLLVPG